MAARLVDAKVVATGFDTLRGAVVSGTVTAVLSCPPRGAGKRQKGAEANATLLIDGAATDVHLVDVTLSQHAGYTLGDEAGDIGTGWPAGVLTTCEGLAWHPGVGRNTQRYVQFIAATNRPGASVQAIVDAASEYARWATECGHVRSIFGAALAAGAGGHLALEAAKPALPPLPGGCLIAGGPTMAAMRLVVGEGRCVVGPDAFGDAVAGLCTEIPIRMRGTVEAWLRGARAPPARPPHTADADWWIFANDAATAAAWPFLLHPGGHIGPTQWRSLVRHAPPVGGGVDAAVVVEALGDVGAAVALRVVTAAVLRRGVAPTAATGAAAQLVAAVWMEKQGWPAEGPLDYTGGIDELAKEIRMIRDSPEINGDTVYYHLRRRHGDQAADLFTACFWGIKSAGAIEGVALSAPAYGDYRDGKLVEAWVDIFAHLRDLPIPDLTRLARYGRGPDAAPATSAVVVFLGSDMAMRGARAVALPGTADCSSKLGWSKATGRAADTAGFFFVVADRHIDLTIAHAGGGYAFTFGGDVPTVVVVENAHSKLIHAP